MPSSLIKPTKLEMVLLSISLMLFTWWATIEYLLIIPKPLPTTKIPLSFRTGDLLFFRGLSWVEKTIQTYTRCRYNHVSLVVEEMGKYFLWEADVGEGYRKGPRMIPLEVKLAKWRGTRELAYRPIKKSLDLNQLLSFAQQKTSAGFDTSMLRWIAEFGQPKEEKFFCSELIALTLRNLGVLRNTKRNASYSPRDLAFGKLDSHFKTIVIRSAPEEKAKKIS